MRRCLDPCQPLRRVESAKNQTRRLEGAVAVAERDPDAGVAEPDDVGLAVSGDVDDEARVLVDAPALIVSEVPDDEPRRLERAVAVAERDPDAGVAEADDVGLAVSGDVGDEAGMPVDAPALVVSEVADDEPHAPESSVAVVHRRPDAGVAKAENVRAAVPGQIRDEPRMIFDRPAGVEVESAKDHVGRQETAGAGVEGGPDAVESETDDVRPSVSGEVGDKPGLLGTPTLTSPAHFFGVLLGRSQMRNRQAALPVTNASRLAEQS